ncbi:MAG: hypothetical protein HZB35_09915 [Nitrospirae bacterium]|nr:hypothetical protein [Nitrospirota bacterium]
MEPVAALSLLREIDPVAGGPLSQVRTLRPLSFDEKKAAEAAFQGHPLNPVWSQTALEIYFGVQATLAARGKRI